ncbi:MAG TPA: DUF2127 domain-containing protein [Polyangia bacterium]
MNRFDIISGRFLIDFVTIESSLSASALGLSSSFVAEEKWTGRSPALVRAIGAFKLLKALLLAAAAVGLFTNDHLQSLFWRVVGSSSERALDAAGIVTALYALVFLVEGTGLLLVKRWAEWLTVIVTTSFIPFEIWKLVHDTTAPAIVALALNIAIVVYLAVRLAVERNNGPLASRRRVRYGANYRREPLERGLKEV